MGVKALQIPAGSNRWYVRVNFKRFRKTKLVGVGAEFEVQARQAARYLTEAFARYGLDAVKLIEPGAGQEKTTRTVPTVAEYAPRFLATVRASGLKRSTVAMYESNLEHHIVPELAAVPLDAIDYGRARDFLAGKSAATFARSSKPGAKRYPYSRDTLRVMAMTLRALMSEAVRERIIPTNPIVDLSQFYRKRKRDRVVSRSQVFTIQELRLLEAKFAERFPERYEFVLALSREGMRVGEAVPLLVSDVDFRRDTISISKNVPSGIGELEDSAKSEAGEREIEFSSSEFRAALEAMLRRRAEDSLRTGRPASELLFPDRDGRMASYDGFKREWDRAVKLAGVRRLSPHSLRHTWASHQLEAGAQITWIARHLGHASAGVTLTRYAHFVPGTKRARTDVLDSYSGAVGANETQMGEVEKDVKSVKR